MVFKLYDASSAGSLLGAQTLNGVVIAGGLFTVQLNGAGEFGASAFTGEKRWLEISVNGTPLLPRQALTATPYASTAMQIALPFSGSASVDGNAFAVTNTFGSGTALSGRNEDNGAGVYGESPNGAGVRGYSGGLGWGVYGNSPSSFGVYGQTTSGRGVFGSANGGDGVYGLALAGVDKAGVRGSAAAPTGFTYGGYFDSVSDSGIGVVGRASSAAGGTIGAFGSSSSTSGTGVYGLAEAFTGSTTGVLGQCVSTSGIGVYGAAVALTGVTNGVYGQSNSPQGNGVYGLTTASLGNGWGVFGETFSVNGVGVIGRGRSTTGLNYGVYGQSVSTDGRGVYGEAYSSTGNCFGVLGYTPSPLGWSIYAAGNLGASGVKAFRMDHPDDPANKYLLHYAAESPEVINFYSGKVLLDGAGEAVVELPHYFAKINTDPRYTLTAVGAPMPMLHVAEEIDEAALRTGEKAGPEEAAPMCSFRIAGGAPGAKVSWEVKALRNDRWVQRRGAPVEVEKQDLEKGTYQHPELYGQPAEMGMNFDATRAERATPVLPGKTARPPPPPPDQQASASDVRGRKE